MKGNNYRRERSVLKRVISVVLAASIFTGYMPESVISDAANKSSGLLKTVHSLTQKLGTSSIQEFIIDDMTDLETLVAKHQPQEYQYATLIFKGSMKGKGTENFKLGSSEYPFKGKIVLGQSTGNTYAIESAIPLFDYICDSVEIVNESNQPMPITFHRILMGDQQNGVPLFANNVVHDTDDGASPATNWQFYLKAWYDENNTMNYCYRNAGLFGTVGEDANVTVMFDNSAYGTNGYDNNFNNSNVYADNGNAGLICGTMKKNANVRVKLTGTNTAFSVESSGDNTHAGKLVGEMDEDASLTLVVDNQSYFDSMNGSVSGKSYAGGLVGYYDKAEYVKVVTSSEGVDTDLLITSKSTVTGTAGAGGLFGYYSNKSEANFDLTKYNITSGCKVKATNAGAIFGYAEAAADITVTGGSLTASGDTVTNFGGVAGKYQAVNDLTSTLFVHDTVFNLSSSLSGTSCYGGVVGLLDDSNSKNDYIKIDNFTHNSSGGYENASAFGGVIGSTGDTSSMIDVGTFKLKTNNVFNGGGIVGVLNKGVLRLSGTTEMSEARAHYTKGAQIVGTRESSLVYAAGTGNDDNAVYNNGWTFNRYINGQYADDIGTWGQVVRVASDSKEGDTIYFDKTNHTVRIAGAELTMDSADDFIRTALNIQLNDGSNSGALCFADTSNSTQNNLLSSNDLKISGTIDLAGTGITGFTRDNGTNSEFKGTLTGENNATVKLAIGEFYGKNVTSPDLSLGKGYGEIFKHQYNALFAKTGTGASVKDITIGGYINNASVIDSNYVAGLAAVVNGGIKLTNVDTEVTINENTVETNHQNQYIGGLIANVSTNNADNIMIEGTAGDLLNINPGINLKGNYANNYYLGGAIGRISSVREFTTTLKNINVAAKISTSSNNNIGDLYAGGVIADIASYGSNDSRTIELNNVTINGTNLAISNVTSHTGGFLGYAWHNTNVVIPENGLTVTGSNTIEANGTAYIGGLLSRATGHWEVQSKGIKVDGMNIKAGGNTGFSVLILDGYNDANAGIYLELLESDSYTLADTDNMKIPSNTTVYDELVAYSGKDVLRNGNGVISIRTNGEYSMDGSKSNGYINVFNQGKLNDKSRYYYNVSEHRNETTGNWALLNWSLNKYACANIRKHFNSPESLSGEYDLKNISYYPIDIDTSLTIGSDVTVRFQGNEIYSTENAGNDKRLNNKASQHYLMHAGLFRNVNNNFTANNLTLSGNVINDATYTGALACGTVSNEVKINGLVLDNLSLKDITGYLLINKIETETGTTFNLSNTSAKGYDADNTPTVAKSLIGKIKGKGINLTFSSIKLDGRKEIADLPDLNSVYNTSKSIFSDSTLIYSYDVDASSTGEYNFSHYDDWGSGKRTVTYGAEIISSVENAGKQKKYYIDNTYKTDDARLYTRPDVDPALNDNRESYEDFSTKFLPYVAVSYAAPGATYTYHELKVNVLSNGITEGCGTYNHPYEISSNTDLITVSKVMNKSEYPLKIRLPMYVSGSDSTVNSVDELKSITDTHWCSDADDDGEPDRCAEFTTSGGDYTYTENGTTYTWTREYVSLYIASAYYMITKNFTIEASDNYIGLGVSPAGDTTGKYAFRGVIVGKNDGITITNASSLNSNNTMGLISMSNGCVIRNLKIEVKISESDTYNYNFSSATGYAYNENAPAYGAVINKIMGGDNIIDNVKVTYTYPETANVKAFKISNGTSNYYATIGGYVGCIINGGLMFRNMTDDHIKNFKALKVNNDGAYTNPDYTGETGNINIASEELGLASGKDLQFLYINKFVGRVINGYAINETDRYAYSEDGKYAFASDGVSEGGPRGSGGVVTLHNSRKNYVIPDIDTTSDVKLEFSQKTGSGDYNVVTANDAQSLYILSLITQSGAGCATSENNEYLYNISYCGKEYKIQTCGNGVSASNNKATRLALYDKIGEAATSEDYTLSCGDTINDTKCVPYIIHKYTGSYDGKYPARTLTQRTFFIQLGGSNETFYLPDSFRGIGFIGYGDTRDSTKDIKKNINMKVYGFNGNNKTIDLNTFLPMYGKENDIYYKKTLNKSLYNGPALFNKLYMIDNKGDYTTVKEFNSETDYQITNFDLQGYISGLTYYVKDGVYKKQYIHNNNIFQDDMFKNYYATGGIVSCGADKSYEKFYNFTNINLKNLTIESTINAAGFVPFLDAGMLFFNNCNGENLTVRGGGRVGGFVGTADGIQPPSGMHVNANIDGASTTLNNINIEQMHNADNIKFNFAGGLISSYWGANPLEDSKGNHASFIFNNVTVTSDNGKGSFIGNVNGNLGYAGGIIGNDERSKGCVIINCKIEKTNIQARCAGGIFASNKLTTTDNNDKAYLRIVNCWVSGEIDPETGLPRYKISGKDIAGGVIGYNGDLGGTDFNPKFKNNTYSYQIDGCLVKDYAIETNGYGSYSGAGGLLGVNSIACTMVNSKVEGCKITNNGVTQENRGVGGVLGYSTPGKSLKGYNIVVSNNKLESKAVSGDSKVGNLIGYANNNNFTIQFAGYSRNDNIQINDSTQKDSIDIGRSGTETGQMPASFGSSYLVFADYNSACSNIEWNFDTSQNVSGLKKSDTKNVSSIGDAPYATVEDQGKMGAAEIIMGDSAVLDSSITSDNNRDKIVAKAIISHNGYSVFDANAKATVSSLLNADEDANMKLTTYLTEFGDDSLPEGVDDFPIIAVSQTASITGDLNAYANVVTNTNKNYFANKDDSAYGFDILKCQYIDGDFKIVNDNPSLSYNTTNTNIQMNASNADTNQDAPTFTLIDIKFYDPVYQANKEVAYHVYIPVVTKNMIKFNFRSSSVSETSYLKKDYQSKFGNNTAENFDNWMTMYVSFEYPENQLQFLIDNGTGLCWNNDKIVRLSYDMESSANNTKFVLVDPNGNRDQVYYAKKSSNTAAVTTAIVNSKAIDTLTFKEFTDVNNDKTFKPIDLNELVTVTYSTESEDSTKKIYVQTTKDDPEACVYAYASVDRTGEPQYFKKDTSNQTDQTYALTVHGNAIEQYYISSCVNASDNQNKAYYFSIDTQKTLNGKSKSIIDQKQVSTVLLGDLFTQENFELTDLTSEEEISTSNNVLNATVATTVKLMESSNKDYFKGKFTGSNFKLYQSFVLCLNRVDSTGNNPDNDQQIHGEPICQFPIENTLLYVEDNASFIQSPVHEIDVNNIDTGVQIKSQYSIVFPSNDTSLEDEFPTRTSPGDLSGIKLSVSSNLAYNDSSGVTYSTKSITKRNDQISYHMSKVQKAVVKMNAKSQLDIYDKYGLQSENMSTLGINSRYLEDNSTRETILANVEFDLSKYSDISNADKVEFELSLEQKQNKENGDFQYNKVNLNDYLKNITLNINTSDGNLTPVGEFSNDNNNKLVFVRDQNGKWSATYQDETVYLDYYEDKDIKIFTGVLSFEVVVGDEVKKISGFKYANYKLILNAALKSNGNNFAPNSFGEDHLIYTNAKVNANFVNNSN